MMKLELHPQVHTDILEIMEFYEEAAGAELAAEFYSEFRRYADQIASRPESFPIHVNQLRRCNLDKFPHHILYEIVAEDRVQILVVKHDRREPSFGLDR
jgi:plasmid stabilization system protein ParE